MVINTKFDNAINILMSEKVKNIKVAVKNKKELQDTMGKDKRFKSTRGLANKHLNIMPNYNKVSSFGQINSSIDNLLERIKQSNRGIWAVNKSEVLDIAKKYKFFIPNENFPTKHLGSSGVILWRKGENKYFLVKNKKQKYNR